MRILLLCHSFNSLSQRLWCVLREAGHAVSVELDIADSVTEEAVQRWRPDLVIAPFLKRRIPASVWQQQVCLVVHPGPPGDRGPSALDGAVLRGEATWGVTVLQANGEFDAGEVWAWAPFEIPPQATKGNLYRHQVTQAAVQAVAEALARFEPGRLQPRPAHLPAFQHHWQPLLSAEVRRIDWAADDTARVLRKIRSADGAPGAPAQLFDAACRLFDAHPGPVLPAPQPGVAVARRGPAVLVGTRDASVWIGHVRREALKLATTTAFEAEAAALPELALPLQHDAAEYDELHYTESGPPEARVGWLTFAFHNGAMSTRQCRRLQAALTALRERPTAVLVLLGGPDFFSNGLHLHDIEAAASRPGDSAAEASWRNIEAMNDATLALLTLTDRLTVAALRGNAGAGGCFLALAADLVWAHAGVVLNPHYKNMGNLHGSEYWTYLLPRRLGAAAAREVVQGRLPIGAAAAQRQGLIDACFGHDAEGFAAELGMRAAALASADNTPERIAAKARQRAADEAHKPLAAYRDEELQRMHRNFYGFDPSYHVARHHFVHRKPQTWTPRHLALHR
jgi:putative two-component system hydrogenase maturation factor HypX/HoxX